MAVDKFDRQPFEDPALSEAFATLPPPAPPPALDAAILAAAHAAVPHKPAEVVAFPHRPRRPWRVPFAMAASVAMAFGVAWHLKLSGTGNLDGKLAAAPVASVAVVEQPAKPAPADVSESVALPMMAPPPPPPPPKLAIAESAPVPAVRRGPREVGAPEPKPSTVREPEERNRQASRSAVMAKMAQPAARAAPMAPGVMAAPAPAPAYAAPAAPAPAPMTAYAPAASGAAPSPATAKAASAMPPPSAYGAASDSPSANADKRVEEAKPLARKMALADTPEHWIADARAKLAAGDEAGARKLVRELRERWPAYVLPDDLAKLLPSDAK